MEKEEWTRKKLIKAYIDFFKSRGHKEIPNASLVPENDPTVLFTTAGMHPLVPFLLGEKHPQGKRLVNVQRCIRTNDIEEVGDDFHLTFFEMLGNWSLGDYFKKEAIEMSFEFLTKILKIPIERIEVSCFAGDEVAEKDIESSEIWKSLGINKIKFLDRNHNWWGPAGNTGPCGPDTEMFVNGYEIWNDVFMQYNKNPDGSYSELKQKNVDTGMGVERTLAILNNKDMFLTDCFLPIIKKIEEITKKSYEKNKREMRIIADHIKASVFIISDGVIPSNIERGYVLRRLIRRAIRYLKKLEINFSIKEIALSVFDIYDDYKNLKEKKEHIIKVLEEEEKKFLKTLSLGEKLFEKIIKNKRILEGKDAFLLYQSYGFPLEMIEELAKEKKIKLDVDGFKKELKKHQELSRTASAGVFKSGLADNSEQVTKLHTATHLLNRALKIILKDNNIHQKGSNITAERLRFDFNFQRKLTNEELKKIEDLVNQKIKEKLEVVKKEMSLEEAKSIGAEGVFENKYKDKVSVYFIGDFSKEICSGPHVKNTKELGKFKIVKEEAVASGIRRIKAILE
ncbi:MAG: alanine--tRNA ligase [Candidatus Pacearchaeota archaeon]